MTERRTRATPEPDVQAGWPEPRIVSLDRRRVLHAFDWGALAAIAVSLVYGILWRVIELDLGLIAVAVVGGWLIGAAVTHGAWRRDLHIPSRRLRLLAAILGGAAWAGGAYVAFTVGQAVLPEATTPLLDRLSFGGFAEYVAGVYDIVHGIALATLIFFSWRSTR